MSAMSGELALEVAVTTLAFLGICAATILFWFYGAPYADRWLRWLVRNPAYVFWAAAGLVGFAILALIWVSIFELVKGLL
jgi:hypothetical protein